MLFNSPEFLFFFLPIVVVLGIAIRRYVSDTAFLAFIVLASLYFYAWNTFHWVFILIASIVVNYALSRAMEDKQGKVRKRLLTAGVVFNLGLLGYYKYTGFLAENIEQLTGVGVPGVNIVLPIGISFYTFQQIAYLVDCYRGAAKDQHFLRYAFFIAFFPQLIAGPIVHHSELMSQLKFRVNKDITTNLALGSVIFLIGLAKKILIADTFARYATPVFEMADAGEAITTGQAWMAMSAYSLQIYFDFSGYSDMAIGLARMFGLKLPINFASPYQATSIIDFWRCWHMTLSRFLRDYLYIPLGGSRLGPRRRYINLILTMLLGGLWHGAGWGFVLWGALHGLFLTINHGFRHWFTEFPGLFTRNRFARLWNPAYYLTLLCVALAWIPFRAETLSGALTMWAGLWPPAVPSLDVAMEVGSLLVLGGCLIAILMPNTQQIVCWVYGYNMELSVYTNYRNESHGPAASAQDGSLQLVFATRQREVIGYGLVLAAGVASIVGLALNNQVAEFIYFQF